LALLRGETVPPYNYVEHRAITADRAWTFQPKPSVAHSVSMSKASGDGVVLAGKASVKAKPAKSRKVG
jgi:hypothetical protein